MSALASQWLLDTFIYTGLLIGLVLLLRRPVAKHFGPTIAYALWALPLLRFIMPPLVLPASMAPVAKVAPVNATEPLMVIISDANAAGAVAAATNAPPVGIALMDVLIPVWLLGALGFLVWRAHEYRKMRSELLAEARPVGESGAVRLVETPAVTAPVAFGIGDKVVALPPGFMALFDREARDMAIAHELAHHRGFDLLANILAQPVLALHWFNPLAWWGWRAMRRDQEAACDARVIAGRDKSERAAYAQVIAGFAAGDDLALAAPMACPVLGEKSIIHRLRSLSMTEVPTRRRRLGIGILATTALALPVTASITYAQSDAPSVPVPPLAPAAELVPAPPAPPMAPDAPEPPAAPDAPEPPSIETVDPDRKIVLHVLREDSIAPEDRQRVRVRVNEEGETTRIEMSRARAEAAQAQAEGAKHRFVARELGADALQAECTGENTVISRDLGDGRKAMIICQKAINDHAMTGLRSALEAIRHSPEIPDEARREAIESIQEAIEELEEAREQAREQAIYFSPRPTRSMQLHSAQVQSAAFASAPRIQVRARIQMKTDDRGLLRLSSNMPIRVENADECESEKPTLQANGLTV